ncbi:MAG: nitroreductase family protein, partial [Archaeoglobaceae archaeon]
MDCFECLERIIKERRSHRFFLEKPVEREKLEKILELAMWAPSAMNRQQWFFVVVGKERMKSLRDAIAKSYNSILPRLQKFFAETPKVISI